MFFNKLSILFIFLILLSCSSKETEEVLVEQDLEKQMIELYTKGLPPQHHISSPMHRLRATGE